MVVQAISVFCKRDNAQDLVEFTLLLAMVGLMAAAIIVGAGQSINMLVPSRGGQRQQTVHDGLVEVRNGSGTIAVADGDGSANGDLDGKRQK